MASMTVMTGLMDEVAAFPVPRRSFALWYLGQNGWILKAPSGFTAAIDPYLSDFCNGRRPNMDMARQLPVFVAPEALKVDLLVCTHSHVDHACPVTIAGAVKAGTPRFMGPAETHQTFASCGVPEEQRIVTYPNHQITFADLAFTGVFALPTDHTDLTHMGFVIEVDGGPRLYITGDTAETDLLETAGRYKPQVMCVCINAGFKNLSHWQAAELVKAIDPEIAIPCHFDMFRDNFCPPHMFRASLAVLGIEEKYRLLDYAKPFLYPATSKADA
jgi:L-ascorbate metabolism protein UlaG (beta-lactamase superfamily)